MEEIISNVLFKKTGNEIFELDDSNPKIPANNNGFKKMRLKGWRIYEPFISNFLNIGTAPIQVRRSVNGTKNKRKIQNSLITFLPNR